jgi:flagellar assembly protein FliH
MSTLSKGGGTQFSNGVESFIYQDTAGAAVGAETVSHSPQRATEGPAPTNGAPRMGEEEMSRLILEARAEGIREGERRARAAVIQETANERGHVAEVLAAFESERIKYYSNVEVELVHFALAIAAKILHREAQVDRMLVAGLVKVMLEKLQQGTKVTARVSPDVAASWKQYFHDNPTMHIAEDTSLGPNDCVLETEVGVANLGLDAQLKEIEKGFFDLLAQWPLHK